VIASNINYKKHIAPARSILACFLSFCITVHRENMLLWTNL